MKNIKTLLCFFVVISFLSGCKFVRPTDADKLNVGENKGTIIGEEIPIDDGKISPSELPNADNDETTILPITENPVSIVIEHGPAVDADALTEYFYSDSANDLLAEGYLQVKWSDDSTYIDDYVCNKDSMELIYDEEEDGSCLFWVWDNNGEMGYRYEAAVQDFTRNEISQRLMELYPEEDLEACSREEAIAFCAPVAKACGYEDAKVSVYAMTKEVLNDYPERARMFTKAEVLDPPYVEKKQNVSMKDILEAQKSGNKELVKELKEKLEKQTQENEQEIGVWTEDMEAYLLVYQSVLNGRLFDTTKFCMRCIYVPAYNKVVYVHGQRSAVAVETLEEVELITEEEALAEALRVAKIDSVEKITLKGISMVYSPRYEQANETLKRRVVDPCWRIDYQLSEELMNNATVAIKDDGTVLINAVDGRENKYAMG